MTNLEWLRALPKDEMAIFLTKVEAMKYDFKICEHCEHYDKENGYCAQDYMGEECPDTSFMDWLDWEHESDAFCRYYLSDGRCAKGYQLYCEAKGGKCTAETWQINTMNQINAMCDKE